ncbi:hypothetical protein [Jannaschia sp. LMIT008]|uniref:HPr kinase/phosphorylase n=1 Tax=Jannaschia maritima TaxID=3032585 RepID=UPI0028119C78|nr:hypothetical protein [Jannaschia sp. LMIT008]
MTDLPRLRPVGGRADAVSMHATAVAVDGRALCLCGPPGIGKSGMAAQMMVAGAALVADDLCLLTRDGGGLRVSRPDGGPAAMDLRGLGVVGVPVVAQAEPVAVVLLGGDPPRIPAPEDLDVLGLRLPVLRQAVRPDTAAKLILWLRNTMPRRSGTGACGGGSRGHL